LQDQAASTPLERGETLLAIADGYTSQTLPSKAIPAYEQAITLFEQAGQSASRDLLTARVSLWHAQVSASEASPSTTVAKLGRLEDQLHALVPPEPKLEIKVLMTLAVAYREMGQYPAAVRAASQSLSIAENLHDPNVMLAERSRFYLAFALEPTDPARATQLYQQSIAVYTKVIGHGGTGLSELYGYEGASLAAQGRHAEAAEAFATALELTLAETTPRNDLQDNLRAVLAHEYLETGRCQDAANLLQPALAQFAKQAANHSAWSLDNQADALDILALCAMHAGQLDQAQRDIDQKLTPTNTLRDNLPVDDGVVTPDPSGLVQVARHHFDEARQTLAYLDAQNRHAHVAENSSYALNARLLEATLLLAQGQSAQAADITTRAVATSNHRRTPCDLIARNLQVVQAQALHALGKPVPTSVCHGYTILPPTHET
jgi:tetratricopeptide (TPR) repeat protein